MKKQHKVKKEEKMLLVFQDFPVPTNKVPHHFAAEEVKFIHIDDTAT